MMSSKAFCNLPSRALSAPGPQARRSRWGALLLITLGCGLPACKGSVSTSGDAPEITDASVNPLTPADAAGTPTPAKTSPPAKTTRPAMPSASPPSTVELDAGDPTLDASASMTLPDSSSGGVPPACPPVRSHKKEPQRALVSDQTARPGQQVLLTADLFTKFYAQCGACHVDQAQGGWKVTRDEFGGDLNKFDAKALARITTDDLKQVMPPFGQKYSAQPEGSPLRDLVTKAEAWLTDGAPRDFVVISTPEPSAADLASPYLLPPEVAAQVTDLGTCLPDPASVATETTRSAELDTMFAAMTSFASFPQTLSATDLSTLDSAELARHGVISYAPTYGLFSGDARKMRYVRVPRGQSVHFDPELQEFDVPENTRIYKTFLKEVIDVNGNAAWRKIETRIIVVRKDEALGDGKFLPRALFGTYAWNDAETEAYLVTDPQRDSTPFADRLVTFFRDEPGTAAFFSDPILAESPTALATLQKLNLVNHWAIPSEDRCVDCHRGSPNHSFLLGFSPFQLARVPRGESGEFDTPEGEEVGEDELSQLSRLIAYGIVTGIGSEAEVARLEDTQLTPPRNEYELKAQAYMVGNCAFCHNPHGLPSVQNPELTDLLNFWPNHYLWPERDAKLDAEGNPIKTVGIFQFPLDRTSPRIRRGPNQDIAIPYITPSLRDFPIDFIDLQSEEVGDGAQLILKHRFKASYPKMYYVEDRAEALPAPWRSLIYRNVETPFTYGDHYAIYPHMPMNVPGYDCRVPGIMADWMVSIPAQRVAPEQNEDVVFYGTESDGKWFGLPALENITSAMADLNSQPYVEVPPGSDGYAVAELAASQRLEEFHEGPQANYCPDTKDILDPEVLDLDGSYSSRAGRQLESPPPRYEPLRDVELGTEGAIANVIQDGVPAHAHWVNTDLTEPPGLEWQPKNLSWSAIFENPDNPELVLDPTVRETVKVLKSSHLTDRLREFALSDRALAFWEEKPECELAGQMTVRKLTEQGIDVPQWLQEAGAAAQDRPLYMQAPGETVFTMICSNCHGPDADSKGRQAALVSTLTGGNTRVADFKNGFFGPVTQPGANLNAGFGPYAVDGDSVDDVAGRYMAFMALGGTQRTIPRAVLSIVRNTAVAGTFRKDSPTVASPNMLETAVGLCTAILGVNGAYAGGNAEGKGLITTNGDREMWKTLCTFDNPMPLRVMGLKAAGSPNQICRAAYSFKDSDGRLVYPADAAVGNHLGETVVGIDDNNLAPWCVSPEANLGIAGPVCPPLSETAPWTDAKNDPFKWTDAKIREWATRGAINAGFAVYTYLDALFRDGYQRKPAFNRCEELIATSP